MNQLILSSGKYKLFNNLTVLSNINLSNCCCRCQSYGDSIARSPLLTGYIQEIPSPSYAIGQGIISDCTLHEFVYRTNTSGYTGTRGQIYDCVVNRYYPSKVTGVTLLVKSGTQVDDWGLIGATRITPTGVGVQTITGNIEVSDQVTIDNNKITVTIRTQDYFIIEAGLNRGPIQLNWNVYLQQPYSY